MSSRDTSFAEQLTCTLGAWGVDVLLNSLTSPGMVGGWTAGLQSAEGDAGGSAWGMDQGQRPCGDFAKRDTFQIKGSPI